MSKDLIALIVDDDKSARNILKKYIEIAGSVEILGSVENTFDAMKIVEKKVPDIIFLDINMPDEDGLCFAKKLKEQNVKSLIVFTTAYKDYALSAFCLKPLDYLVKPFGINDVFDVLTNVKTFIEKNEHCTSALGHETNKLKFKTDFGYSYIDEDEVLYFIVDGAITEVVLCNMERERLRATLIEVQNLVSELNFLRINRSTVINLNHLSEIDRANKICKLKGTVETVKFVVSKPVIKLFDNLDSIKIS